MQACLATLALGSTDGWVSLLLAPSIHCVATTEAQSRWHQGMDRIMEMSAGVDHSHPELRPEGTGAESQNIHCASV